MKRVLYLASSAALLASMVLGGNALAAHQAAKTKTVQIRLCTSTPIGVASLKPDSQGIQNGVALAVYNMKAKLASVHVKILPTLNTDYAKADGSGYDASLAKNNVDACAAASHSIGLVGTLNSGAALVGEPEANLDHLVMISPANTSPLLTQPSGRKTQEPLTYKHKIPTVTYFRTVTTDKIQGDSDALFAKAQFKAKSYYAVDDGLAYGDGLEAYFTSEANKLHLKRKGFSQVNSSSAATEAQSAATIAPLIKAANPDFVFCGCDEETTGPLASDLRKLKYSKPWEGGDAFVTSAWFNNKTGAGPSGAKNSWATSVGPDVSKASSSFVKLYKKVYPSFYRNPGPQAYDATSFDAATAILMAAYKAEKAKQLTGSMIRQRTAIVANVAKIKFTGATGKVSFDKNGDTKDRIISVYKGQNNKWKFLKLLKVKGSPV